MNKRVGKRWRMAFGLLGIALGGLLLATAARAAERSALPAAIGWFKAAFAGDPTRLPFSFTYDGASSRELLPSWSFESSFPVRNDPSQRTLRWLDATSGLAVRCEARLHPEFSLVEWTVYFENTGSTATRLLEMPLALDLTEAPRAEPWRVRHWKGSQTLVDDFAPAVATTLPAEAPLRLGGTGGRPMSAHMPYLGLDAGDREGLLVAIGWPGQWFAECSTDAAGALHVAAGQEQVHLRLKPGEVIRTPRIAMLLWSGDVADAHNLWRRWMQAHNMPRFKGRAFEAQFGSCFGGLEPTAESELTQLRGWKAAGVKLDYWVLDAGWYPHHGRDWSATGTWRPDPDRFPQGMRPLADFLQGDNAEFALWFEPERVVAGTALDQEHPAWLLDSPDNTNNTPQLGKLDCRIFNLANPEARAWLTEHIDGEIQRSGVDCYRQDFNIEPLNYWRHADEPDRQGATENHYVQGYLAYFDALLERNPGLWIDTCASGGRRNDIETLRRAIPLLRSDNFSDPVSQQAQTHALSLWIPYYGSGTGIADAYVVRSSFCPSFRIGADLPTLDDARKVELRQMTAEYRRVGPLMLEDFYPLTPYNFDPQEWIAYQFHRPDHVQPDRGNGTNPRQKAAREAGCVLAFRRSEAKQPSLICRLRGLEPAARYHLSDQANAKRWTATGEDLMRGLAIEVPTMPGSALIEYERATPERPN